MSEARCRPFTLPPKILYKIERAYVGSFLCQFWYLVGLIFDPFGAQIKNVKSNIFKHKIFQLGPQNRHLQQGHLVSLVCVTIFMVMCMVLWTPSCTHLQHRNLVMLMYVIIFMVMWKVLWTPSYLEDFVGHDVGGAFNTDLNLHLKHPNKWSKKWSNEMKNLSTYDGQK